MPYIQGLVYAEAILNLSAKVKYIIVYVVPSNISARFSSSSEADASELLENLEEMFPRYRQLL